MGKYQGTALRRYTFPQGLPEGKIGIGGQQSNTEFEYITITGSRIGLAVGHIGKLAATWAGVKAHDQMSGLWESANMSSLTYSVNLQQWVCQEARE